MLPLLLLAGCEFGDDALRGRLGDPVTAAALNAPRTFGEMGQFQGDPAGAARAVAQLEFLTETFRGNPVWAPRANPLLLGQLRVAQGETREALGIDPSAATQTVIDALEEAARQIDAGQLPAARRGLSAPVFTAGGAETLTRLSSMQPTRVLSLAAQAANQAGMVGPRGGRR